MATTIPTVAGTTADAAAVDGFGVAGTVVVDAEVLLAVVTTGMVVVVMFAVTLFDGAVGAGTLTSIAHMSTVIVCSIGRKLIPVRVAA